MSGLGGTPDADGAEADIAVWSAPNCPLLMLRPGPKKGAARRAGGKLNFEKLKKRATGMVSAMPLDDEGKWWLALVAEYRLDELVKLPHEQVLRGSRRIWESGQESLGTYCGIRA